MLLVTTNQKPAYTSGESAQEKRFWQENMKFLVRSNDFDSSEEDEGLQESAPLHIDWLDIPSSGSSNSLGITSLPGCKFGNVHRNLEKDLGLLTECCIQDIFVFCTQQDLHRYRVPTLLQDYSNAGFLVHHFPFEHGDVPSKEQSLLILQELSSCFNNQRKTVLHCHRGLGRSCLVAATFMLSLQGNISPDEVIERLKELRGSSAIETVKQYNFIHEYRDIVSDWKNGEGFQSLTSMSFNNQRRVSR